MDLKGLQPDVLAPSKGCDRRTNGDGCLNDDVWHLILRYLRLGNLFNISLVSKRLYHLTIPHMHHRLVIAPSPGKKRNAWKKRNKAQRLTDTNNKRPRLRWSPWDEALALIRRLAGNPHGAQARAVQEIEATTFEIHGPISEAMCRPDAFREEPLDPDVEDALAILVKALPNLRHFRLMSPMPQTDGLIRAMNDHRNRPRLHLLCEDGSRVVTGPMPSVTTIRAWVNPYYDDRGSDQPNRQMINFQKLFFACPNLKSFSLTVYGNYGGCFRAEIRFPICYDFRFTGDETFPPGLESLSLDGYRMEPEQWPHWRHKLNWSNLSSLSLGPQPNTALLAYFRGNVTAALRCLKVETWAGEGDDHCPELEQFLLSFDSLEQLTVTGHFLSNRALRHHPGLKRLCLHAIEISRGGALRPTMAADDLRELDTMCPDLEDLEIDIYRDSHGWPGDIITALASGFANVRHLTLHSELGIDFEGRREERMPLPPLDGDLARAFAQPFFACRRPGSKLNTLTLRTGEKLRRFRQWTPRYREDEITWSTTVHIRVPLTPDGEPAMDIIDCEDPRSELTQRNKAYWDWLDWRGSDSEGSESSDVEA